MLNQKYNFCLVLFSIYIVICSTFNESALASLSSSTKASTKKTTATTSDQRSSKDGFHSVKVDLVPIGIDQMLHQNLFLSTLTRLYHMTDSI